MQKKLLLTVAVVSALGINSSAQALGWDAAKNLFDTPVTSNNNDSEKPAPVPDSQLAGESEPNNSASSADPINSGVMFTGQLFSEEDQDWFRFETTQNNAIVTLQTTEANGAWTLTMVDRAGNTIASTTNATSVGGRLGTDDSTFRLAVTAERAGTYYLIVQPADSFSADPYRITVTISDPTNPDNPVIDANFNDLETEPNNGYDRDGILSTDPLASGKPMYGQLLTGGDEDWFTIQSPGNEIIDIDFCGFGSPCEGQANRIVMVLKKDEIDAGIQANLSSRVPVFANIDGQSFPAGTLSPYIEYLGEQGLLGNALIGKIHPDFGEQNQLQIGIDKPGTYYFVVAGKLQRDGNGAIDTHLQAEKLNCDIADAAANSAANEAQAADAAGKAVISAVIDKSFDIGGPSSVNASKAAENAGNKAIEAAKAAQEAADAAKQASRAATKADVVEISNRAKVAAEKARLAANEASNQADNALNSARRAISDAKRTIDFSPNGNSDIDSIKQAIDTAALAANEANNTAGDDANADAKTKDDVAAAKTAVDAAKAVADTAKETVDTAAVDAAKKQAEAALELAREARKAADAAVSAASAAEIAANSANNCDPETAIIKEGPFVVFEDFNDDQYSIRIRRTNLAPHTPGTPAFIAERQRAIFDNASGIIHIPELEFNGAVFEVELINREDAEFNLYELLQIRELDK